MGVKLNLEQVRASTAKLGTVAVIAGAGTGKTTTIVSRIKWMIEEKGIDPNKIVAVTFTTSMAAELLKKLKKECPSVVDYNVCTIHAFCLRLLTRLRGNRRPKLAFDWMVRSVIESTSKKMNWNRTTKTIRWWIDRSKQDGIKQEPEALANYFFETLVPIGGKPEDVKGLVDCAIAVNARLEEEKAVTFSDMVNDVWQLLKKKHILKRVHLIHEHVLVDEGQDTFPLAVKILRKVATSSFFIVGDPDQKLFGFTGADPDANLFKVASSGSYYKLTSNYRSTKLILDAANSLISNNYDEKTVQFRKELSPHKNIKGDPIVVEEFDGPREESEWVVDTIAKNKFDYGQVFVGARTNAQLGFIEQVLARRKIPYVIMGHKGFFSRNHIKKVVSYLALAINEDDDDAFVEVYNLPSSNFGGKKATRFLGAKFLRSIKKAGHYMAGVRQELYDNRSRFGALDLVNFLNRLKSKTSDDKTLSSELIEFIMKEGYLPHHLAVNGLIALDPSDEDNVVEDLIALKHLAKDYPNPKDFLDFYKRMLYIEERQEHLGTSVGVSTVHGLKGLERDVVFGLGFSDGLLPHWKSLGGQRTEIRAVTDLPILNKSDVTDERCIAFVLITRARKRVFISSIGHWSGKELEPSRFIEEMTNGKGSNT